MSESITSRESSPEELRAENEKLRRQVATLMDRYARLEVDDMEHTAHVSNQKRLTDFIQRITMRLDDDELLDVMMEEFLLELKAERVSYILPESAGRSTLAVTHEAVQKGSKRLALPHFISPNRDNAYTRFIYQCLEGEVLLHSQWDEPVLIVPDFSLQNEIALEFQAALEDEFDLAKEVDCRVAMACPLDNSLGGPSIICVQRRSTDKPWSRQQRELFSDMCRYAGSLLEQTQLTQQVRELKDQLSSLVESMPSAIIGMDLLGTVTMWNGKAVEFFGLKPEEAIGRIFWEIVPAYGFIAHAFRDILQLEHGSSIDFESQPFKQGAGQLVYHKANLFSLFSSNRGEVALRVDDVSRTVELNHQLFHSQRMETVGTLAGGLAHDFNNVLGGIVGTVSLMKQRFLEDNFRKDEFLEDVEVIESCTSRASDMVKRLLALSRRAELHSEPLDLNASIQNVLKLCRASFDSRIQILPKFHPGELYILADQTQLEQAILNICVNARDAMKTGGTLYLETAMFQVNDAFRLKHSGCQANRMVKLSIRDTGEGIPLENLDKIFDPFFSTKSEKGTGLGLSIVDNIVKQHKGYLELESEEKQGTAFHLYFMPINYRLARSPLATPKVLKGAGRILVVDDDEISRKTATRILAELGYTVVSANNGASAVKMFEDGIEFDLVLMDVDMPVMNGLDTARLLRRNRENVRVLFITGRQHQYELSEALGQPLSWFIPKPFNLVGLAAKIRECLRKSTGTRK